MADTKATAWLAWKPGLILVGRVQLLMVLGLRSLFLEGSASRCHSHSLPHDTLYLQVSKSSLNSSHALHL